MDTQALINEIDAEIARLQYARNALAALSAESGTVKRRRGRPPKNSLKLDPPKPLKKRRTLSAAARAKIAAAQRKRWAAQKKAA